MECSGRPYPAVFGSFKANDIFEAAGILAVVQKSMVLAMAMESVFSFEVKMPSGQFNRISSSSGRKRIPAGNKAIFEAQK